MEILGGFPTRHGSNLAKKSAELVDVLLNCPGAGNRLCDPDVIRVPELGKTIHARDAEEQKEHAKQRMVRDVRGDRLYIR